MPYQQMPQFKSVPDKMLEIPQPGMGGLNLRDLEFEQDVSQSPYMLNMMYRSGAFSKRYGQELMRKAPVSSVSDPATFGSSINAMTYFNGYIFVHATSNTTDGVIFRYRSGEDPVNVNGTGVNLPPTDKGQFIAFAQKLYYFIRGTGDYSGRSGIYEYQNDTNLNDYRFSLIKTYVPTTKFNCRPGQDTTNDPTYFDQWEAPNIIGGFVKHIYNGTGSATKYYIYDEPEEMIDWDSYNNPVYSITVDGTDVPHDSTSTGTTVAAGKYRILQPSEAPFNGNKAIVFGTAPPDGDMNVEVTWIIKPSINATQRNDIYRCKFHESYGGTNNSCLFVGGCGNSKYYYSNPYDISYFPVTNDVTIGNTTEDISGFGRQYNSLIVFKPHETHMVYSYMMNSSNTNIEENYGLEGFKSQIVNSKMGCDCPYSIQLINNLLTWFSTRDGVCTLVSTNIQDERNIRVISRNVEKTNNFGIKGILDYNEQKLKIQSADYDSKYFLVFPESGMAYVWDYEISPYKCTSNGETPPEKLAWFLFDHFYVNELLRVENDLIFSGNYEYTNTQVTPSKTTNTKNMLIKLNMSFSDIDYKADGYNDAIEAYYMTPFIQFGAVESLKNVRNIYVQTRGDTASKMDMWYYDEETGLGSGEKEPESIIIGGRLWQHFLWTNFTWYIIGWASAFRRKCNLKKVQMASFYFENKEIDRDMSITHIGLQYQLVKYVR